MIFTSLLLTLMLQIIPADAQVSKEKNSMYCEVPAGASFRFDGVIGERIEANVNEWLLSAPVANPGMLEMFRVRDREPVPQVMPWAGEFAGKYLISAVQALRMTEDTKLHSFIAAFVAELISTQDDDGYLGPFRKHERLLGQWDLWGHYHVMLGLLMWYEDTGDKTALDCSSRIADLVCRTFLNTDRTIWDAGSHEMNMAIIHSLGRLYRHTNDEKYLAMMQDVLVNWQRPPAGDYLRTALEGQDFYRTPKPRWESLHDIQGLTEMYEITDDEQYRKAFSQIWTSIRNYDRHPSGGFTTGEQAVGNPYSFGAIETCCTIAWMALTVDMLRLTGDPAAADELELATWNSMLGSQHPSGRWWTYNTPLDGVREASAHTIVFQSRYGTPELNCCSVNAPRGLGMLSEWAVMVKPDGLLVNYYGPGESVVKLADGTGVSLKQETNYPAAGKIKLTVTPDKAGEFSIGLRIPAWSVENVISVNGQAQSGVKPGSYYQLKRNWQAGDVVELSLDMRLRCWSGELARQSEAVIYRGPVLLTLDQKMSALDTNQAPQMDLRQLEGMRVEPVDAAEFGEIPGLHFKPIILIDLPTAGGGSLRLCDFATAGAHGTAYQAWLSAMNTKPAWFHLKAPWNISQVAPGPIKFEWSGQRASMQTGRTFRFELARDAEFKNLVHVETDIKKMQFIFDEDLAAGEIYWWQVTAINAIGETVSLNGQWAFTINGALPRTPDYIEQIITLGPDELLVSAPLNGTEKPEYGMLGVAYELSQAPGAEGKFDNALSFNGATSRLTYELAFLPEEEYSVSIWAKPETVGTADFERVQQLMSLWAVIADDPLRIVLQKGQVSARIETQGQFLSTATFDLPVDQWANVAVVKDGASMSLYINGEMRSKVNVPAFIYSAARNVGVGCNPNYGGVECFKGSLAQFKLWARALTDEEIAKQYHEIAGE